MNGWEYICWSVNIWRNAVFARHENSRRARLNSKNTKKEAIRKSSNCFSLVNISGIKANLQKWIIGDIVIVWRTLQKDKPVERTFKSYHWWFLVLVNTITQSEFSGSIYYYLNRYTDRAASFNGKHKRKQRK